MIRDYCPEDLEQVTALHAASELPANCLPDFDDPLFLRKTVIEHEGKVVMVSALRGMAEIYVLVDHAAATPLQRWEWLKEINAEMKQQAWLLGLDQISCWVPQHLEKSFGPRLEELGYQRSPWACFTLNVVG